MRIAWLPHSAKKDVPKESQNGDHDSLAYWRLTGLPNGGLGELRNGDVLWLFGVMQIEGQIPTAAKTAVWLGQEMESVVCKNYRRSEMTEVTIIPDET